MKRILLTIATFCSSLFAYHLSAKVVLPKMFSDNMVIQRETTARLWGTATPGATVKVSASWTTQRYTAKADADGRWQTAIDTPEAGGPYTLTFDDGEKTIINNILSGELWLCSGQSNMEMQMKGFKAQPVEGAYDDILDSRDASLRLFTVKRKSSLELVDTVHGSWQEAQPQTVRDFSATAYYFGRALRRVLDVPVGLIVTAWGGSACEAWMTADWLRAFPDAKIPQTKEDIWSKNRTPTLLYNGMLHPLVGITMRGALWYQGEDNVNRYPTYAAMLSALIQGWRSEWGIGDFPFYYCQIAPFDYQTLNKEYCNSAFLREQQTRVELTTPNTAMAVLMDAGLEYGIHPRKKRQAGERLAFLALKNTYGVEGLPEFARYKEATFKGDTAVISFEKSKEWVYFDRGTTSDNFEAAAADSIFHPAKAWVSGNKVYVTWKDDCKDADVEDNESPTNESTEPVVPIIAVRYAFKDYADGDLFCDGLPVSSFRTDNWEK